MIRPQVDIVEGDAELPAEVDLAVIGGGIIGCAAALWAAEQGYRVALIEKGRIAGEQSGRNWGWVRRMGRDPAEYPLGIASFRLWDGLAKRVGADIGFRRSGIVYTATTKADMAWLEQVAQDADNFRIGAQWMDAAQVLDRFPGATFTVRSALWTQDDGRAEPALAAPAMARAARTAGASVLTGCAVRSIETAAGRVSAVLTESGRIGCGAVILAGGAWSRLLAGNLGIDLPLLRIRSSVLRTGLVAGGPSVAIGNGQFGLRPRLDGGYTIARRGRSPVQITPDAFRLFTRFMPGLRQNHGSVALKLDRSFWDGLTTPRRWSADEISPFERCRVLDPEPLARPLAQALRAVQTAFPVFKGVTITERWGGIIDVTPDGVPIIDKCETLPGLVIATGFSGHGFGLGPAAGQLAGELATGAPPLVDPAPFALSRFNRPRWLGNPDPGGQLAGDNSRQR